MSQPLYVAFIWHQHQPLYYSRVADEYRLPWVRLHGTKDYLDLVLLLEKYPKLHQTVNLVPSLILQIEDYAAGTAIDPYLALALKDAKQLDEAERRFAIANFFDAHHRTMIDPHPRYRELYEQRQEHGIDWCFNQWQSTEYDDLLAWHNLAWIDPLFWDDPEVATWLKQGRGFTRLDRQAIWAKQREILARIVPQHRKMQESGQLEVTTTPYTHPILPLLADTNAGRVAVPGMELPEQRFQWSEDIPRHLSKAKAMYTDRFGVAPRGLWPSEQSVSPAILPDIAKQGFEWICSDEATLGWSLKHFFHRDGLGNVQEPELLYRPYRLETPEGDLSIVFRDHRLSDLIGFTYGNMPPQQAAADLIGHLEAIREGFQDRGKGDQPWLVTIALDGENCWEFYQQDGKPFLEALYQGLSNTSAIELVTVSEFLDKFPATETIPAAALHSGSWVDGSFTTWIGDPVKNRAWDLLSDARQTLANHPEATEESNPTAWEALYAAEGSDWFWWFGEGHSSNQDAMFDQLFREHLVALYQALGEAVPDRLYEAVENRQNTGDRGPHGFIHPIIDGRGDEQDWDMAGRMELGGARGTMHQSRPLQRLWYGVDHLNFYLRFDLRSGIALGKDCGSELHLFWYYPGRTGHNSPMPLEGLGAEGLADGPTTYLYHHHLTVNLLTRSVQLSESADGGHWLPRQHRIQLGIDNCIEIAVPWADLQIGPDWMVELVAVTATDRRFEELLPESQMVRIGVP
jgi:alpha-amylase/alpha-mannosidase (GH57 family)